jgi:hypothetical protein
METQSSNDVNPATTSSVAASPESANSNDVKQPTSSSGVEAKSTEVVKPSEPTSIAEVVTQTLKDSTPESAEKPKEFDSMNESNSKAKDDSSEESEPQSGEGEGVKEGQPVPYTRFKQVLEARNTLEQEVEKLKPVVEGHRSIVKYCKEYGIDNKSFSSHLELAALRNSDPEEYVKRLTGMLEEQGVTLGAEASLPPDIQKLLDDGDISEEVAQRLAKAEREKEQKEKLAQSRQAVLQKQTEEREISLIVDAANTWESAKRKEDLDYRPKTDKNQPDGKWELVRDRFLLLSKQQDENGNFVHKLTTESVIKLMDRAYQEITKSLARFTPSSPAPRRSLNSNGSQVIGKKEPTSLREVVDQVLAEKE